MAIMVVIKYIFISARSRDRSADYDAARGKRWFNQLVLNSLHGIVSPSKMEKRLKTVF